MTTYSGICYDGPLVGEKLTHYAPFYTIALMSPLPNSIHRWVEPVPFPDIKHGRYVWSRTLHKWCYVDQ